MQCGGSQLKTTPGEVFAKLLVPKYHAAFSSSCRERLKSARIAGTPDALEDDVSN